MVKTHVFQDTTSGVFIAEGSPIGSDPIEAAYKHGVKQHERGPLFV